MDDDLHAQPPAIGRDLPPYTETIPLHGLSGALRRRAYRLADWRPRRWMLLMLADRVDVLESGGRLFALAAVAALAGGLVWRLRRR
jgi:hypothetical protein